MKSFQNLLQANEKSQLSQNDLLKTKGGAVVVETMVEITATINGVSTMLFCDRRRKRIGA